MLILTEQDMWQATIYEEIMDAVEDAFLLYSQKQCLLADRISISHNGNTMLYMPCFAGGYIGTKILAEWPENPKANRPYLDGLMILNDEEDGHVVAIMKGDVLTADRTGAVGGVAIRHLAKKDARSVGLVGCGVQGLQLLCYACMAREIQTIYLYDGFKKDLHDFVDKLITRIFPRTVKCVVCPDADALLKASDIVLTATQATQPLFTDRAELFEGKCIIAIGSWKPSMREIPEAIWQVTDTVYTELPFACEESGDLAQPLASGALTLDHVQYMGDYLQDKKNGVQRPLGATQFYKSVGMAIFDTMAARQIYRSAKAKGLGQEIRW